MIKCFLIHSFTIQRVVILADLYWFIRFLCLLYLNITSNSIKFRMHISKLIVLYNPTLPRSCIFTMNLLRQSGQIKNAAAYGLEEWYSKFTTDDMIEVELSQYTQRKPIHLIRSIISCFSIEYWLLISCIAKLLIVQACIYSR